MRKKMWLSTFDGELIRYDPVAKKFKKYNYQSLIGKKYLEPYVHIVDICTIADKLLFAVESNAPLIKSILEYDVKMTGLKYLLLAANTLITPINLKIIL